MNYSAQDKQNLIDAIASGALEVAYSDKKIRYRSLDDMIRTLKYLDTLTSSEKSNVKLVSTNKGY